MTGAKWKVTRDGRTLAECDTDADALAYLHTVQGRSASWAIREEGFDIVAPSGAKWSEGGRK